MHGTTRRVVPGHAEDLVNTSPPGRSGAVRRHLRWIIPLVLGPAGYVGFLFAGSALTRASGGSDGNLGLSIAALVMLLLALATPVVALVFFLVGAIRTFNEWRWHRRHATGKLTPAELAERDRADHLAASWKSARQLRAQLARREVPPQIQIWNVVPNAGETFFFDTTASYARFYGQDVSYTRSGGYFFGHPLFVVAGVSLSAAGNAARRSSAGAAAQAQWREHQSVRLLVSNQRLVCNVNGQWLSFYYSAITAVYPEVNRWALVCQFDSTSPLLLHGPDVPMAALITVLMTHGPVAIENHPSLTVLGR